ncbi:MAG: hypothetical protein LUE29_00340 [Lachnospiraceae bacterium]|nr:hypothetical protein [Lachnospiraceae bacterium]
MLQYKNGRFFFDIEPRKLSFQIPDRFWLNTEPGQYAADLISLCTEDKAVEVEVYLRTSHGKGTEEELKKDFEETPEDELDGPHPVSVQSEVSGEFHGHALCCIGRRSEYVVNLDIGKCEFLQEGECVDRLVVTVTADEIGKSRDEILADMGNIVGCDGIRKLMESIRVE